MDDERAVFRRPDRSSVAVGLQRYEPEGGLMRPEDEIIDEF
jgi:hypothetical protein